MKSFKNFSMKKEIKCKEHNKEISAFCNKEKELLCIECINLHNNHKILSINDAFDKNKQELMNNMNKKIDFIKNKKINIKKEFNNINKIYYKNKNLWKNFEKEAVIYINNFVNKYEKECEKLINYNKNIFNKKVNKFQEKEDKLRNDLSKINHKKNNTYLLSIFAKNEIKIKDINDFKLDNKNFKNIILNNLDEIYSNIFNNLDNIKSLKTSRNKSNRPSNKSNNKKKNRSYIKINKNLTKVNKKIINNKNDENKKIINNKKDENKNFNEVPLKFSINKMRDEYLNSNIINDFDNKIKSPEELKFKTENNNELRLTIQNRINLKNWNNKKKTKQLNNFILESNEFINSRNNDDFNLYILGGEIDKDYLTIEIYNNNKEKIKYIEFKEFKVKNKLKTFLYNDIIYIFIINDYTKIYEFNIKTFLFKKCDFQLKEKRKGMGILLKDNIFYFSGGIKNKEITNDFFSYDLINKNWINLDSMNIIRDNHSMIYNKEGIFILGGFGSNNYENLNLVEFYDFNLKKWLFKESMIIKKRSFNSFYYYNKIYNIGGILDDKSISNKIEIFDLNLNKWSIFEYFKDNFIPMNCDIYNDYIYIIGSFNEQNNLIYEFDLEIKELKEYITLNNFRFYPNIHLINF